MSSDEPVPAAATGPASAGMIDWDFAMAAARRVTPAGPRITAAEGAEVVAGLRHAALAAQVPVAQTARLHAPAGSPAALVVDRPTWIEVNAESFKRLLDPVVGRLLERGGRHAPSVAMRRVGGKVTGTEVAGLLGLLSTKVLGQYEFATGRPAQAARLLLVAPNVAQVERELRLVPADFRLWVCLHEETHRVQFTAVPWLRGHVQELIATLTVDLVPDLDSFTERLRLLVGNLPDAVRPGGTGVPGLLLGEDQKHRLAEVTAVMSLLEGHADVVMDDVGPQVVPTVAQIRRRFDVRRQGIGPLDILLRRLLGIEAKMGQYRDGAAFVRAVNERVGVDGFNAVWSGPDTLPTAAEIADPARWVARVHG